MDEKTKVTGVDYQYLYQQIWVFNEVLKNKPKNHHDISSTYQMSCYLASITNAVFLDLRPIKADIKNLKIEKGSIENLPYKDDSLESVSCLHVVEHIGLGRYGDELNVNGDKIACKELARVLRPGGKLYFSTPIGRERICYNAHRVFNPNTILRYFNDLDLINFSIVDDDGKLRKNVEIKDFRENEYSLGMFEFTKKKNAIK